MSGQKAKYSSIDVGDIRRKQIIAAVRQIISRDGIEAVTIANIATELGTSRGVVVYHFDNKDAILREVLESAMKDADRIALKIGEAPMRSVDLAGLIAQVAKLARLSGDWWKIYFSYLAHAHVNETYREALVWSDRNYRSALASSLGSSVRATLVLALMKGLAMQVAVEPEMALDDIEAALRDLLSGWQAETNDG